MVQLHICSISPLHYVHYICMILTISIYDPHKSESAIYVLERPRFIFPEEVESVCVTAIFESFVLNVFFCLCV